jgi:CPA2 family monovalent cation:H+ antiporter-2
MRARYFLNRDRLLGLGATDVVTEEVEATVEVMARLLRWLETPRNVIDEQVEHVRSRTQSSDRALTVPRATLQESRELAELKIESFLVREGSCAAGCSAVQLNLRARTGALIVAVRRRDALLEQPDPEVAFEAGDIVYFVGTRDSISKAMNLLNASA